MEKALLCLIISLALVPRLFHLESPLLDNHSFRQTHTAMQSYFFYKEGNSIFDPRTTHGRKGINDLPEFPIYTYLIALLYSLFGFSEIWGRAVSIAFSLGAIFFFYRLLRKYFSPEITLTATSIFALCPLFVFYSRCFIRQGGMGVFFIIAMVFYFTELVDKQDLRALIMASVIAALGLLVNPASGYVFAPMLYYLIRERGLRGVKNWRFWIFIGVVLGLNTWWLYHYTFHLNRGVVSIVFFNKGSMLRNWLSPTYYIQWIDVRFFRSIYTHIKDYILSYVGIFWSLVGFFFLLRDRRVGARIFLVWLIASLVYVVLDSYPFFIVLHEYYFLFLVPPLTFMFAYGLCRCLDLISGFREARLIRVFAVVAIICFYFIPTWNRTRQRFYKINKYIYEFTQESAKRVPKHALIYTICWGPEILYYSHRYGWWTARAGNDAEEGQKVVDDICNLQRNEGLKYVLFADFNHPYDKVISEHLEQNKLVYHYVPPDGHPVNYYVYKLE